MSRNKEELYILAQCKKCPESCKVQSSVKDAQVISCKKIGTKKK
jgi:hypothetical protein